MKYEIVEMKEKRIVGVCTTTSNEDPGMGAKIGKLWMDFYGKGIAASIQNKVNTYAIGLYSDYNQDGYTVTVGNEVTKVDNGELVEKVIPAGRYAKFSVHGNMQTAVGDAWGEIWKMPLERSFTGDYEEYLNASEEEADIDIYIALK